MPVVNICIGCFWQDYRGKMGDMKNIFIKIIMRLAQGKKKL